MVSAMVILFEEEFGRHQALYSEIYRYIASIMLDGNTTRIVVEYWLQLKNGKWDIGEIEQSKGLP